MSNTMGSETIRKSRGREGHGTMEGREGGWQTSACSLRMRMERKKEGEEEKEVMA